MAADDARAERIRALKSAYPDVRWHEIAAYVGVSERSALSWAATGAIAPGNAAKLNEFFRKLGAEIDDDYADCATWTDFRCQTVQKRMHSRFPAIRRYSGYNEKRPRTCFNRPGAGNRTWRF